MTKMVRIENADNGPYKVVVQVWDKGPQMPDGLGGFNQCPDTLAREILLANPCDMTDASVYLTSTRYLVVKEAPGHAVAVPKAVAAQAA